MNRLLVLKQGINKKFIQAPIRQKREKQYGSVHLSIISSNCAGGVLYHDYGMQFESPTINLFFENEDFLWLCEHLHNIQKFVLKEDKEYDTKYPVGILGGCRIHFLHYNNFDEAKMKWCERTKRIDFSHLCILLVERDEMSKEQWGRFLHLPYRKIAITPYRKDEDGVIHIPYEELDSLFHFRGITGKRVYEKYMNLDMLMEE